MKRTSDPIGDPFRIYLPAQAMLVPKSLTARGVLLLDEGSQRFATRVALSVDVRAHLSISSMAFDETRVEFDGANQPPLGVVGDLLNAAIGHQIAEATVHRFVNDIIEEIRREVPARA